MAYCYSIKASVDTLFLSIFASHIMNQEHFERATMLLHEKQSSLHLRQMGRQVYPLENIGVSLYGRPKQTEITKYAVILKCRIISKPHSPTSIQHWHNIGKTGTLLLCGNHVRMLRLHGEFTQVACSNIMYSHKGFTKYKYLVLS